MNSLIVAIIIGIFTAIYNKNKVLKKQSSKAKPFSINRGKLQDIYTKLKENTTPTNPPFAQPEPSLPKLDSENINIGVQIETTSSLNGLNQFVEKPSKVETVEKITDSIFLNEEIDHKRLVDGVIWSEILGEPRSKNPYFSKRK